MTFAAQPSLPPLEHRPVTDVFSGVRLDGEGTLTQQVHRLLWELIVRLDLLPNQFLSEKDVAAGLAISKTPVREAFIRLAEDGMVRIVPKSGTYVSPINLDRASEGLFIWTALESACAERAACRYDMKDLGLLRDLLSQGETCIRSGDTIGFVGVNRQFHRAIVTMADMAEAQKMVDAARFEVKRIINLNPGFTAESMRDAQGDHSELVGMIVRHDTEGARESMGRHLGRIREIIRSFSAGDPVYGELFTFLNRKRPGTRRSRSGKSDG